MALEPKCDAHVERERAEFASALPGRQAVHMVDTCSNLGGCKVETTFTHELYNSNSPQRACRTQGAWIACLLAVYLASGSSTMLTCSLLQMV
jgi:hypothetical protein